jgi:hypothetical protein
MVAAGEQVPDKSEVAWRVAGSGCPKGCPKPGTQSAVANSSGLDPSQKPAPRPRDSRTWGCTETGGRSQSCLVFYFEKQAMLSITLKKHILLSL